MYKVTVENTFYAEHAVMMPDGQLEEKHGHDWNVKVCASAAELDENGFAFEFGLFKKALSDTIEYVGGDLFHLAGQGRHPTTELICKFFYDHLAARLNGIDLEYVEIEEEKGCLVRYCED
ncbi:MAG: 6-pyruvoyl tetrahydropterin synthase family protein [Phycisphaerae bacterium]|jgi:6-pyruvoyltetrahydropterin/6-carboxytetrahydropterin synthase